MPKTGKHIKNVGEFLDSKFGTQRKWCITVFDIWTYGSKDTILYGHDVLTYMLDQSRAKATFAMVL